MKQNQNDDEFQKKRLTELEKRKLLIESILEQTEQLTKKQLEEKTTERENEIIKLIGGGHISISAVKSYISSYIQPYYPMFPNTKPFFKLMYKLCGWDDLDPNQFIKPPCVALWIKQYIYARFSKEVLPTLLTIDNPVLEGHIRKYKLFQFLNTKGQELMEGFIDDAIRVMKTCKTWYEFEKKYTTKYKLSLQLKMFND